MLDEKKLKLTDLIDIEFLQEFQDFFAKTMGVASIAVDETGPITKPSNFSTFCDKYTRGNLKGLERCNNCDIMWGKLAAERKKPQIYKCHTGLTDFAVPIIMNGIHIASILGGQVLTEPPNEEHFRAIAKEFGINEDEYIDAVKQIKIVSPATIEAAANFLFLVANAISKIAQKNFKLMKKSEMEETYRSIIEAIRSSLNINETKQVIVNIMGKTLCADRCYINEYDKSSNKFLIVQDEYLSSDDILSYKGSDSNVMAPVFTEAYKQGKTLIIKNKQIYLDTENQNFDVEKQTIEKFNINSAFGYPLFYRDEFLGALVVHYVKREHNLGEDEINLMTTVGNQIAIALHQAKLYNMTQANAERETLLRNIIETIRSSLDIEKILSYICEETAKLFNVERSAIGVFPTPDNYENFIMRKEYRSSQDKLGFNNIENAPKIAAYWGQNLLSNGKILAFDNIETSDAPSYFKNAYNSLGVKSMIGIAIQKGENVWGTLVLSEYEKYRHWSDEEKLLLATISDQVYIAINQAELYEQEQLQIKREKFNKSIIEILRNTIDKNIVKHLFVRSIAKNFNADRVFFSDFDPTNNTYLPIDENSEYLSSQNEKSFVGQNWSDSSMAEYIQPLLNKRELKISCWDEYVKKNVISEDFSSRFTNANVKSSYNFPVIYEGEIIGFFCIEFTQDECRKLSDEDINSIRTICTQAGIALFHAELYRREKESAEREHILREVISKIRSSLDIEDIKYEIVNQIGVLFKADRVCVAYYDQNLNILTISPKAEYKSYTCEKSFRDVPPSSIPGFHENIVAPHLRGENIIFGDLNQYLKENPSNENELKYFYEKFNIQALIAVNITYNDAFFGSLVTTFAQPKKISDDDVNFLKTIADQAGTAFYQAELLDKEKQTAKRETLLRKIAEIIRSSLDISEIKKNVVNEIGKTFNADRCYFRYFNKKQDKFLAPDVEYLGSSEIPTLLNEIPNQKGLAYFIEELNRRKQGFYPIVVDEEFTKGTPIEQYFKYAEIKADYAMPIIDKEDELTYLVLHYTKENPNLSKEDKSLLEAIASQVVIALDQAKLYEKEKETAQREIALRKTIKIIRSSLDLKEIKKRFIEIACNYFDADRCLFDDYSKETGKFLPFEMEILRTEEIKSLIGVSVEEHFPEFADKLKNKKRNIIIKDLEKTLSRKNLPDYKSIDTLHKSDAKSDYGFLVQYQEEIMGILIIHYVIGKKSFTHEEMSFLKTLGDQVGIAIYQAELYEKQKETVQKEKFLREMISEIKITQNIDQAYNYLLNKLTDILDISGAIFIKIPDLKYETPSAKYEYIRNNELTTFLNIELPDACGEMFFELAKNTTPLIINDVKSLHTNNEVAQNFCKEHSVKSMMVKSLISPYNGRKTMGIIVVCSKELRNWSERDIDLLNSIIDSATSVIWEIIKLNEINELINTFILTLSQGVQIPLGEQEKFLEFLLAQNDRQSIGKFRDDIKKNLKDSKDLFALLTKLLDSYNYESGKKKLHLEQYNISDIINKVKDNLIKTANSKLIKIKTNLDINIPDINIDKDEVEKVIYNLLENAIYYTQNKGIVEIKSYKIGKDIVICISDNGPGIAPEIKDKIFQRYATQQIIEKKQGSGMGLYLSKLIAEAHGGKIWCESEVGVGTIVCFLLPAILE